MLFLPVFYDLGLWAIVFLLLLSFRVEGDWNSVQGSYEC